MRRVDLFLKLANTSLTGLEHADNFQPALLGYRPEYFSGIREVFVFAAL
jgi:hypothetical protein